MSTKETLLEVAEKLPPDAMFVDAIYELDRGEGIPTEAVKSKIAEGAANG